ncbi:MAG: PKD domain-containing protein [Cyanobacteriota bacterium]|nr:PKD domain-containing protein [Cyanobacteriota bacterium]
MKLLNTRPIFLGMTASVVLGIATSQPVKAASFITFENIPGTTPSDGLAINNQFLGSHGITFSMVKQNQRGEWLDKGSPVLAQVGGKATAFVGPINYDPTRPGQRTTHDMPAPGQNVGMFFLTDDGKLDSTTVGRPSSLLINYNNPVSAAYGELLDIDQAPSVGNEKWLVTALNSLGGSLESVLLESATPGTGDGIATPWHFLRPNADISAIRIDFTGTKRRGIGLGFDNFSPYSAVLESSPTLKSFLLNGQTGDIDILEAQPVLATLFASDPDRDLLDFLVNGNDLATVLPSGSSDSASTTVQIGPFLDDGSYTQTAQVKDSDGVASQTITRTINVQNVAPTLDLNLSNAVINEGESALVELSATDPGADAISFFLNDEHIGTDTRTSGNRLVKKNLGVFADEGTFTYTGKAEDDDGGISNVLAKTLTVKNLDPTITSLTEDFTIRTNTKFDFAATATDPGINDILSFDWDLDGDGLFDDFTGSSGQWSFSGPGLYAMNLRVSDGDGGFAYASVDVEAVPEPGSVLGLFALGALGVGSRLRKGKRQ